MNKLIAVISLSILILAMSGCGGLSTHTTAFSWNYNRSYETQKLNYDAKRRVWLYEKEALFFNGKKVTQKEIAEETFRLHDRLPKSISTTHTILTAAQAVVTFPFAVVAGGGLILASPLTATADTSERHDAFHRYLTGEKLLAEGQFEAAREKFHEAWHFYPVLVYGSDLLFKLAETYDREGKTVMATTLYREFLECSLDLYPKDFEEFDKKYVNNLDQLSSEFSKAEEKLRISPSLPF